MIKDRRPYYIRKIIENFYKLWVNYYVKPQFENVGINLDINKPWNLDIYGGNISVGDNVHIRTSKNVITQICSWNRNSSNAKIKIGDNVLISPGARILAAEEIEICSNVMLASNVYISDSDWHDPYDRIDSPGPSKKIVICDNAWIGEGVKISKGVRIGINSIVGLGSIVTSDVPNDKIYAGNPAREVKSLDKNKILRTREKLFESNNYNQLMDYLLKEDLKENNLLGWIRSLLFPRKGD